MTQHSKCKNENRLKIHSHPCPSAPTYATPAAFNVDYLCRKYFISIQLISPIPFFFFPHGYRKLKIAHEAHTISVGQWLSWAENCVGNKEWWKWLSALQVPQGVKKYMPQTSWTHWLQSSTGKGSENHLVSPRNIWGNASPAEADCSHSWVGHRKWEQPDTRSVLINFCS